VTALVVAHLQGRHPPEALTRTRFGIVHLWSIDSPEFRLLPAFALHFQDEYLYPPVPLWPPDDQMQNYHKESLYIANLDWQLRNEIERTGVYIGNDGYYIRAREEGFRRPIIAHILFGLPYELTWTDTKGRSRVFPLRWNSVVLRIMEALKDANKKTAIENAWNTSPLTNMYGAFLNLGKPPTTC
jgi:hypothetical protein